MLELRVERAINTGAVKIAGFHSFLAQLSIEALHVRNDLENSFA